MTTQAFQNWLHTRWCDDCSSFAPMIGMRGKSDPEHLEYAARRGLALVTCNRRELLELHWEYLAKGMTHGGIIIIGQHIPRGERIRLLLLLCTIAAPDDFNTKVEFLADWA